jgi:glycosyltransferase involved in cell wall biosynthesis
LGEIYADLDAYTIEYFEDEPQFHERIDLWVLLPPVRYEGQFLKGICFSQGVDYLVKLHPQLPQLFFTIANSQWCSYPWSRETDAYFTCYPNGHREAWFRQANPDRAGKILIPLQDADFTPEYVMAPVPFARKEYDVVCVSRLHDLKNVPLIAAALKTYRRKYRPIRMALVVGKAFDLNFKGLTPHERDELRKVEAILKHPRDYLELVPLAKYKEELTGYYSRARLCVLGSLIEGKNRALFEALSCNTPVVCFRQFNQYARGEAALSGQPSAVSHSSAPEKTLAPAFPDGAGLYAPEFDAESLADTFHEVFENETSFRPRRRFLEESGRKNFFTQCLDAFPYYQTALPDYRAGHHLHNLWLDLAIQANYQLSLFDFLYDRNSLLSHVRGVKEIGKMLEFYFGRFGLERPAKEPASGS